MAHFAQLDENNIVTQVVVVSDVDTCDTNGYEVESIGQQLLKNMYGEETKWIKTSYNGKIRKHYAGIGYTYDEKLDAFIPPKPFDSWILDKKTCSYVAPIPEPPAEPNKLFLWNEQDQKWDEHIFNN